MCLKPEKAMEGIAAQGVVDSKQPLAFGKLLTNGAVPKRNRDDAECVRREYGESTARCGTAAQE